MWAVSASAGNSLFRMTATGAANRELQDLHIYTSVQPSTTHSLGGPALQPPPAPADDGRLVGLRRMQIALPGWHLPLRLAPS